MLGECPFWFVELASHSRQEDDIPHCSSILVAGIPGDIQAGVCCICFGLPRPWPFGGGLQLAEKPGIPSLSSPIPRLCIPLLLHS